MKRIDLGYSDGTRRLAYIDTATDEIHSVDEQSGAVVGAILDQNHEHRRDGFRDTGGFRPYARVPNVELFKWKQEYDKEKRDISFTEYVGRMLRDDANAHLRVTKYRD